MVVIARAAPMAINRRRSRFVRAAVVPSGGLISRLISFPCRLVFGVSNRENGIRSRQVRRAGKPQIDVAHIEPMTRLPKPGRRALPRPVDPRACGIASARSGLTCCRFSPTTRRSRRAVRDRRTLGRGPQCVLEVETAAEVQLLSAPGSADSHEGFTQVHGGWPRPPAIFPCHGFRGLDASPCRCARRSRTRVAVGPFIHHLTSHPPVQPLSASPR